MKPFSLANSLLLITLLSCTDPSELHSSSHSSSSSTKKNIHYNTIKHSGTTLHYVSFNQKNYTIEVVDQTKGPGSEWPDTKTAVEANNALAGINAGFFTPEGKPLGLCIDDGKKTGFLNKSSLGSGAFVQPNQGIPKLIRRSIISTYLSKSQTPKHLLQAGPFLIDRGKSITVKPSNARPRSFIAWDGKDQWLLGHVEKISLPGLVKMLQKIEIPGFDIHTALNLDGGRSSQLYVDGDITHSDTQISAFMNRKVRNFLIVKKRK